MNFAVIVAGGSGSRMQNSIPKQFMLLDKLPVLMHTMRAFQESEAHAEMLVVLASELISPWQDLCKAHHFTMEHTVIPGGDTRFHSVKQALEYLKANFQQDQKALVAIHDAARPLVDPSLIRRSFQDASKFGSSVAAVKSSDSVRISSVNGLSETIDRQHVHLVQTPQTFRLTDLLQAYEQPYEPLFTDDASVMEKNGYPVHLTVGDTRNMKITFPEDIKLAGFLLHSMKSRA